MLACGDLGRRVEKDKPMTDPADVSTFSASLVIVGIVISVISFVSIWFIDNLVLSGLMPVGLIMVTFGFWLIDRAAIKRIK